MINCIYCGKETTNKKFCSLSCHTSYKNKNRPKKPIHYNTCKNCGSPTTNPKFCSNSCNATFCNTQKPKKEYRCKYCNKVIGVGWKKHKKTCESCNKNHKDWSKETLKSFKKRINNTPQVHARIRGIARSIFSRLNRDKKCVICGYEKFQEVCHIKSISSFSDESTIAEINHPDNLIALCPNCHWELDNGHTTIPTSHKKYS